MYETTFDCDVPVHELWGIIAITPMSTEMVAAIGFFGLVLWHINDGRLFIADHVSTYILDIYDL